jgi:hypothetical protein
MFTKCVHTFIFPLSKYKPHSLMNDLTFIHHWNFIHFFLMLHIYDVDIWIFSPFETSKWYPHISAACSSILSETCFTESLLLIMSSHSQFLWRRYVHWYSSASYVWNILPPKLPFWWLHMYPVLCMVDKDITSFFSKLQLTKLTGTISWILPTTGDICQGILLFANIKM